MKMTFNEIKKAINNLDMGIDKITMDIDSSEEDFALYINIFGIDKYGFEDFKDFKIMVSDEEADCEKYGKLIEGKLRQLQKLKLVNIFGI